MSSNIKIQRICQHCSKEFTARTTVTKYCTDHCSKRAYKARLRTGKIEGSNEETKRIKTKPIEEIKVKEFLTVRDVSKLLNCSIRTTYRLIEQGHIRAVNLLERKTLIKRSEIDLLFELPAKEEVIQEPIPVEVSDSYTLAEVQEKYGISERALYDFIKRKNIPRIKQGWYTRVPKILIDQLLS